MIFEHDLVRKVCNFSGSCSSVAPEPRMCGRVSQGRATRRCRNCSKEGSPPRADRAQGRGGGARPRPGGPPLREIDLLPGELDREFAVADAFREARGVARGGFLAIGGDKLADG